MVAPGRAQVSADAPGVPGTGARPAKPASRSALPNSSVAAGGGDELGAEQGPMPGMLSITAASLCSCPGPRSARRLADLLAQGDHLLGQAGDHRGGEVFAGQRDVLAPCRPTRRGAASRPAEWTLALAQPRFVRAAPAARIAAGVWYPVSKTSGPGSRSGPESASRAGKISGSGRGAG